LAAEQLHTAQTVHAAATQRLTEEVANAGQRPTDAEIGIESMRTELARTRARMGEIAAAARRAVQLNLQLAFGTRIAEALMAGPAFPRQTHYRMTGTTSARGPDRSHGFRPEFKPADGLGLFVILNGKYACLKIWLQEQV
jgi:hypothetical protein